MSELQDYLYGWIQEEKTFLWETRQAIQYDKKSLKETPLRTKPGQIFESYNELDTVFLRGRNLEPLSIEDMDKEEWEHYLMRYPLLESVPIPKQYKITKKSLQILQDIGIDITSLNKFLNRKAVNKNRFLTWLSKPQKSNLKIKEIILKASETGSHKALRIGYIGDQISISNPSFTFTSFEGDKITNTINKISREAQNLDILFVVDATQSMNAYFPVVSGGIKSIVDQIKTEYVTAFS